MKDVDHRVVDELKQRNAELEAKVAELEQRVMSDYELWKNEYKNYVEAGRRIAELESIVEAKNEYIAELERDVEASVRRSRRGA